MRKRAEFWRQMLLPHPRILMRFLIVPAILLLPLPAFDHLFFRVAALIPVLYVLLSLCLRLPRIMAGGKRALLMLRPRHGRAEWFARAGLFSGLLANLAYAAFRLVSGIVTGSFWFCAEAIYYAILGTMRLSLAEEDRHLSALPPPQRERRAWRSYTKNGYLLLVLTAAMSGIVVMTVRQHRTHPYPDLIVYGAVAFGIWRVGAAVYHLVRFRRLRRPLLLAVKSLSLSTAFLSLFALQGTLLARFGDRAPLSAIPNAVTGAALCLSLAAMALVTIFRGRKMEKEWAGAPRADSLQ